MRKITYCIFVIFILLFCTNCFKNKEIQSSSDSNAVNQNSDLYKLYENEILLANNVISILDEYYQKNKKYPFFNDEIYSEIERAINDIKEKVNKEFYYTWLDNAFVLTYILQDGNGLLYHSRNGFWEISESMP